MVDIDQIEQVLSTAEAARAEGRAIDLQELGFWRIVGAVKQNPDWVDRYGPRISRVDDDSFRSKFGFTVPVGVGSILLGLGTVIGLTIIGVAYRLEAPWNGLFVIGGTGVLLGTTHGLAHLAVGAAVGIRFTCWFLDGPTRVQPGLKIDYGSYLRTPPLSRAWMHASGAIVTKLIPFAMLGAAWAADAPWWTFGALLAIGVVQIFTDLAFSVRQSDWKRFRREMAYVD